MEPPVVIHLQASLSTKQAGVIQRQSIHSDRLHSHARLAEIVVFRGVGCGPKMVQIIPKCDKSGTHWAKCTSNLIWKSLYFSDLEQIWHTLVLNLTYLVLFVAKYIDWVWLSVQKLEYFLNWSVFEPVAFDFLSEMSDFGPGFTKVVPNGTKTRLNESSILGNCRMSFQFTEKLSLKKSWSILVKVCQSWWVSGDRG